MKRLEKFILGFVFLVSVIFLIHNISLYNPDFGFDGTGHQAYISWITANHKLPLPEYGWEYAQNPLYYLAGFVFESISVNPQLINLIAFLFISFLIFKYSKSSVALLAFFGLPMANYLVPQISNEYLSGMWIILSLFLILKIPKINDAKHFRKQIIYSFLAIVLGFYTKYTALSLVPIVLLAILLNPNFSFTTKLKNGIIAGILSLVLISPILVRNYSLYGKPLVVAQDFTIMAGGAAKRNLQFFTRLDWIYKADIFNAREYSFTGGLWNTLWHDAEHSISPVVTFHKKAFGLWLLGFPLLFMSLMGLVKILKKEKARGILLFSYLFIAFASLVQYNIFVQCACSVKAFYALGLIVPYVLGVSEFSKTGKWQYRFTVLILLIQFCLMVSYFWIQPWWHVAK